MIRFGRKATLPGEAQVALTRLLGEAAGQVRIVEHSWFAWLHLGAQATTRRRRIYLRGSAVDFFNDPSLVLHEYFHVLGQWETRELSVWRYAVECFRRGYWDNRYEIAAREFAEDNLHRYRALLSQRREV